MPPAGTGNAKSGKPFLFEKRLRSLRTRQRQYFMPNRFERITCSNIVLPGLRTLAVTSENLWIRFRAYQPVSGIYDKLPIFRWFTE